MIKILLALGAIIAMLPLDANAKSTKLLGAASCSQWAHPSCPVNKPRPMRGKIP
jgi:hypothetical protein